MSAATWIPVVLNAVFEGLAKLIPLFLKKPDDYNDTLRALNERIKRLEEDCKRREAEADHPAQAREELARQREEAAHTTANDREVLSKRREDEADQRAQAREELARQREEAAHATANDREALSKRREDEADQRAQAREELARQREEAAHATANDREALSKRREDEARAEAQEAKQDLQKGIRPVVMPTREQISAAKQRVQYDPAKLHFAVCGTSGSGKSSLINALRGLKPSDDAAAKVGVVEYKSEVTRYPDPSSEIPFSRFVWYDIPGAGTINVPDWQYFNDQGLFVFDFIVIVYDVRFTEIVEGIIKNCLLFKIPFFVVRSKADQHIQNMMNDMDEERQRVVDKYVEVTRADFERNLEKMAETLELDDGYRQLLLNQQVYMVSQLTLRGLFQASERTPEQSSIIDEQLLINNMLRQAVRRRYSEQATRLGV